MTARARFSAENESWATTRFRTLAAWAELHPSSSSGRLHGNECAEALTMIDSLRAELDRDKRRFPNRTTTKDTT